MYCQLGCYSIMRDRALGPFFGLLRTISTQFCNVLENVEIAGSLYIADHLITCDIYLALKKNCSFFKFYVCTCSLIVTLLRLKYPIDLNFNYRYSKREYRVLCDLPSPHVFFINRRKFRHVYHRYYHHFSRPQTSDIMGS